MYYVARWQDTTAIIHGSWLDLRSTTFRWPASKNPVSQILKAEPPQENWFTYKYSRISGPFETYDDARCFEKTTIDVSTNDDEAFTSIANEIKNVEVKLKKRISQKPKRYCTTSDEKSTEQQCKKYTPHSMSPTSSENDENEAKNKLPEPPKEYIIKINSELSTSNDMEKFSNKQSDFQNLIEGTRLNSPSNSVNDLFIGLKSNDCNLSSESDTECTKKEENSAKNYKFVNKNLSSHGTTDINKTKPQIHSNITLKLPHLTTSNYNRAQVPIAEGSFITGTSTEIQGQCCCQKLSNDISNIKKMVSAIYLSLKEKDNLFTSNEESEIDFKLKIDTKQEFDDLEEKLKKDSTALQYKHMVKQIGGETFEKHTRRALSLIFSDVMAYRMSWTGAKNSIMVKGKNCITLLIEVIMQRWKNNADQALVEAVVKSWFQHAGDRMKQKSLR